MSPTSLGVFDVVWGTTETSHFDDGRRRDCTNPDHHLKFNGKLSENCKFGKWGKAMCDSGGSRVTLGSPGYAVR